MGILNKEKIKMGNKNRIQKCGTPIQTISYNFHTFGFEKNYQIKKVLLAKNYTDVVFNATDVSQY